MPLFAAAQDDGWTIAARDTARYAPAAMANVHISNKSIEKNRIDKK